MRLRSGVSALCLGVYPQQPVDQGLLFDPQQVPVAFHQPANEAHPPPVFLANPQQASMAFQQPAQEANPLPALDAYPLQGLLAIAQFNQQAAIEANQQPGLMEDFAMPLAANNDFGNLLPLDADMLDFEDPELVPFDDAAFMAYMEPFPLPDDVAGPAANLPANTAADPAVDKQADMEAADNWAGINNVALDLFPGLADMQATDLDGDWDAIMAKVPALPVPVEETGDLAMGEASDEVITPAPPAPEELPAAESLGEDDPALAVPVEETGDVAMGETSDEAITPAPPAPVEVPVAEPLGEDDDLFGEEAPAPKPRWRLCLPGRPEMFGP